MKSTFIYTFAFIALLLTACQTGQKTNTASQAPSTRFESEIKNFEAADKKNGYLKNSIVFTGSSSIRMWSTLAEDMAGFRVVNRGFGGATIPEVLQYADRYLFQHEPQVIVFYCGENDISEGASPKTVYGNFKSFVELVAKKSPKTKIIYISMKPSPARWHLWEKYKTGDEMIKQFIDQNDQLEFMDSSISMLDESGQPDKTIFIMDRLHMNKKGYIGWTKQLLPILKNVSQDY